LLISRNI